MNVAEVISKSVKSIYINKFLIVLIVFSILIGNAAYEAGNITGASLGVSAIISNDSISYIPIFIGIAAYLILFQGNYKIIEKSLIFLVLTMSISFLITAIITKPNLKSLIEGIPEIAYGGQGGLGDILPHPKFNQNNLLYLSFVTSKNNGRTRGAKVIRAKLENGKLINPQLVWEQLPHTRGRGHFSHRLAFGPEGSSHEGMLFISSGDRQIMHPAQTFDNNLGKIIRLHDDGRIPVDNPYANMGFPANTIWTLGHRNVLGLSFSPDNELWANEMGPLHGDELNLISKGENYGWPLVSEGNHYNGRYIPSHKTNEKFTPPVRYWVPTIAPS